MSRTLTATNITEIDASHLHEVVMAKLEFTTPIYVHSGIGTITYDSNDYLGVGDFGGISSPRESEVSGPSPLQLTLSGIDTDHISEALDSGNIYDVVTIFVGYRQDDGTLVDDPWIIWKGWMEHSTITAGSENAVVLTCVHDLAVLGEKEGSRFTDEDQQNRYAGDVAFKYITDMDGVRLLWGGRSVASGGGGGSYVPADFTMDP